MKSNYFVTWKSVEFMKLCEKIIIISILISYSCKIEFQVYLKIWSSNEIVREMIVPK
jgi:hypothetical protein